MVNTKKSLELNSFFRAFMDKKVEVYYNGIFLYIFRMHFNFKFCFFFHLFILIISFIYFYFKMWDKIMKMTFCQ